MRIHLARSSEPLKSGVSIESLCGRPIENAEMITLDAEHLEPRSLGGICPKCFVIAQSEGRTYEAGIVSGEEMKGLDGIGAGSGGGKDSVATPAGTVAG